MPPLSPKNERRTCTPTKIFRGFLIVVVLLLTLFILVSSSLMTNNVSVAMSEALGLGEIIVSPAIDKVGSSSAAMMTAETTTSSSRSLAYRHSFGLLDGIPDDEWESLRAKAKTSSWYADPSDPLKNVENATRWKADNMNPNFDCPQMEGVGHGGQRTKLVCGVRRITHRAETEKNGDGCLIYSVGSAGDFHFEDNIAKMHNKSCEIHVFDPADWSRKGDPEKKNIHYHAWGMISTYDNSKSVVWPKGRRGGFKTLPETLELLGHQNRTIDLFKIDCEGCEWSSINDWIHLGFRQILIETHGVPTPQGTPKARWYQKPMDVSEYYGAFAKHGYALYSKDLGKKAVELSFIKFDEDFWKAGTEGLVGEKMVPSAAGESPPTTTATAAPLAAGSSSSSLGTTAAAAVSSASSSLAYRHSFGLLDGIPDGEWESLRTKAKTSSWYADPSDPLKNVENATRWNADNMNPNFDCPRMEGVGHGGQRTKLVCGVRRLTHRAETENNNGDNGCLIYSVGSAGDFHFEDNIAKMHNKSCEIHVFDPADWSRKGDPEKKNIHYHAWGMMSTYDNSKSVVWPKGRRGGFKTLPETLEILGHKNRTIDLFKIDCEGCEWSSINDWIHLGFRQILIETHGVPTPQGTPKARWYQKPMDVSEYYGAFAKHGYALYSKDLVGNNIMAMAMELSFVKFDDDFWKD